MKTLSCGRIFAAILLIFALAMGCAATAKASGITLSGTGTWNAFGVGDVNENGTPYFDNVSDDGPARNIGHLMTCTGFFVGNPACPTLTPDESWHMIGGQDTNVTATLGGPGFASILIEIAGMSGPNEFGVYDVGSPILTMLFSGPQGPGATATFTASGPFGFYLKNGLGEVFKTESILNTAAVGIQHFSFFRHSSDPGSIYLGIEDLAGGVPPDFQDMVVKVSEVPDPATLLLVGGGLAALALISRRKIAITTG